MANWYSGLFSLGIMLLSYPYALIFNEWRPFYQWISISAIPPLVMMFFVPESYKWLMSQGRTEDAFEIAETIMQKNNKSDAHEKNPEKSERLHQVVEEISYRATQAKKGSLADVFKSKNLRGVTLNLCLAWFTSSTVYYGLGLNAGNLPGSDIFNNFMSGLFEIPAYILFPIIVNIKKLGRVRSLAWAYILGGLCCGISTLCLEMQKCDDPDLLPEQQDHTMSTLGQVFAFVGKFFYAGCFSSCYTYSSEIYPSSVRSNGVGLTSAAARVGGILTPFILGLDSVASWLPGSIYAVLGVVTGICAFWLPETLGKPLLSTVEQTEKVYFSDTEQK